MTIREIVLAADLITYHGTRTDFVPFILKNGLQPSPDDNYIDKRKHAMTVDDKNFAFGFALQRLHDHLKMKLGASYRPEDTIAIVVVNATKAKLHQLPNKVNQLYWISENVILPKFIMRVEIYSAIKVAERSYSMSNKSIKPIKIIKR